MSKNNKKPWFDWRKIGKSKKKKKRWWNLGSYDYDFDRKLYPQDTSETIVLDLENWKGYEYLRVPRLDYRYIEQMANAFAAKYKVDVKIGKFWSIDLKNKILTYDPKTLMTGTKANLICCLLHEIGHLRYSTYGNELKSKYVEKHGDNALDVYNVFEDFRIDNLMAKAYEGADDIFEANKPLVEELAKRYRERAEFIRLQMICELKYLYSQYKQYNKNKNIINNGCNDSCNCNTCRSWIKHFKGKKPIEVLKRIKLIEQKLKKGQDTLFDYCAGMIFRGYGLKENTITDVRLKKRIEKTEEAINLAIKEKSSQGVLSMMDKKVYPIIEDLFDDFNPRKGNKVINSLLGSQVASQVAKKIIDDMEYQRQREKQRGKDIDKRSPSSGHGIEEVMKDWASGDYEKLKQSVLSIIQELVRKLSFLRKKELTMKWENRKKRGKLETKSLYKHKVGSNRLFKKKMEMIDSIRSFAFSLSLDISGSMYGSYSGNAIVHSVRGLIILLEVFERMDIPFEIMVFGSTAKMIKGFDTKLDKGLKGEIAGIPMRSGGNTNLYKIFDVTNIEKRPEKNRIGIIISDGGVSSNDRIYGYDYKKKFKEWDKKGIKSIGLGIACGDEIKKLCLGRGFSISEPFEMPDKFAQLLKDLLDIK